MQDDPSTTEQPHDVRMDDPGATPRPADTLGRGPVDEPSANQRICPFLRSIDDGDRLGVPVEAPDQSNRCAALSGPVPQSLRQQELVCLTSGHVNCPRYMRGAMTVAKPLDRVPAARIVTPAIAGSVLALIGRLPPVGRVRRRQRRADPDCSRIGRPDRRGPGRGRDRRADCDDAGRDAARHRDGRTDRHPAGRPRSRARPPRRARPRRPARRPSGLHRQPVPTSRAPSSRYALLKPCSDMPGLRCLRDPLGRQPVQHRQLLRGALGQMPEAETLETLPG